ncbi:fumarylacetoacetate hydrolase family protein [Capnocytophaga cynodegmi]|uniref:2-hydroxyhepta-2,4-diene-1,7-dioate isomerase n=1 Tax=Capnocytophaga cynodegmi TaxID=28189 RepID=A0A0B7HVB1_9FLAO|nr:fumarylacetoacetate hydrolase family protein [Capnocytophaga cynodegmi]ATA67367.1 2-hydroxyhepta-2,4-diene-1,7-dioate isomerase [Capnocytophaga cynodegmi]CEN35374.1 Acylpyruvase FAHD1, mitochondrial [Capnocytophaga cynodegmi]CEN37092.1 Acylpyruvase FAHD1, mitochondrial [Capnocytophaga cynodegmi]CEN41458.1 Acylpyruvase FAHD1, mitochondrial [Capnocytophaga cynodegmi]GJQ06018.1 2-hydroxyhepta-2,4-diene-1,7-dioate isomerase [Capnocytophaga cynodegmi]
MKIICVGKNYIDHIKEFDGKQPDNMVLFLKPDTAIHNPEMPYYIPDFTNDLHHEIEVILKINQNGKHISEKFAHKYYDEIGLGIDFTARDVQAQLRKEGLSWEKAKAFDGSAIIGNFIEKSRFPDLNSLAFRLEKNGQKVQESSTNLMIWKFDQIISEASKFFTLRKGDIIFTGTPAGVGSVAPNDVLEGFLENQKMFEVNIK